MLTFAFGCDTFFHLFQSCVIVDQHISFFGLFTLFFSELFRKNSLLAALESYFGSLQNSNNQNSDLFCAEIWLSNMYLKNTYYILGLPEKSDFQVESPGYKMKMDLRS